MQSKAIITNQNIWCSSSSKTSLAIKDFKEGISKRNIWWLLAYQDIKLRYRRSALGPFWITISMAITVYSMGFLYGHLFGARSAEYFPYLVSGILTWSLISANINDTTDTFLHSEIFIKEMKLPYTLHLHRAITRNFIIFFHNIVVMLPMYYLCSDYASINLYTLLFIPVLLLIYFNSFFLGLLLAMLAARYRDVSQLIKSVVQISFFITPIIWNPALLSKNRLFFVKGNPVYPFVELVRCCLLGNKPTTYIVFAALTLSLVIAIAAIALFRRYRSRIIYWL